MKAVLLIILVLSTSGLPNKKAELPPIKRVEIKLDNFNEQIEMIIERVEDEST